MLRLWRLLLVGGGLWKPGRVWSWGIVPLVCIHGWVLKWLWAWGGGGQSCAITCTCWFESCQLHSYCSHGHNNVCGLNIECVNCLFHMFVCVEVDCRHHCENYPIKLLLLNLHYAFGVLLGDWWVGVRAKHIMVGSPLQSSMLPQWVMKSTCFSKM